MIQVNSYICMYTLYISILYIYKHITVRVIVAISLSLADNCDSSLSTLASSLDISDESLQENHKRDKHNLSLALYHVLLSAFNSIKLVLNFNPHACCKPTTVLHSRIRDTVRLLEMNK